MQTYDYLTEAGIACKICTNPFELALGVNRRKRRVFLIDAVCDQTYDPFLLAGILRCADASYIALVIDENRKSSLARATRCGANLWLSVHTPAESIGRLFITHAIGLPDSGKVAKPALPPTCRNEPSKALPAAPVKEGTWRLIDAGWMLIAPSGQSVILSPAERDLIRCFHETPATPINGRVFSNMALDRTTRQHRSLTMVISRLQAKCRMHGFGLPIVKQGTDGYLFDGDL